MRRTFEIRSFPDLSLPKYFDLFGEEALTVAATKLFAWLQMLACSTSGFSFTLRYLYDPSLGATNRRLRIFVIVTTDGDSGDMAVSMGRKLSETALDITEGDREAANPPELKSWYLAVLQRKDYVVHEDSELFFLPASWMRHASARTAMEPYLDEAFASIGTPAFLDIQLHAADPSRARQSLRAAMIHLERKKHSDSSSGDEYLQHYKTLHESISTDPVCHLLICAGSEKPGLAEGLLQAFGVDTIGGARFEVSGIGQNDDKHELVIQAVCEGIYEFSDGNGWFKARLLDILSGNQIHLTDPQLQTLKGLSELSVLAGGDLIQDVLTLPIPRRGYLRTFPLETELDRSRARVSPSRSKDHIVLGRDLERDSNIALPLADLTRHGFIAGVTGSGKTVTMFNILSQLAEQGVPFIVFEPAKSEYRSLAGFKSLREQLRIYTPGRDDLNPVRINPFEFGSNIMLSEHVANLVAAFSCALSLFNPLPSILEEALWQLYESRGWKEDSFGGSTSKVPSVEELPEAVNRIIDALEYDPEITSRFKGAFRSRFIPLSRGSVGRLFDCVSSTPSIPDFCKAMSVVELRTLTQQQSNLVTLFTMISIREYLRDSRNAGEAVKLVLVLEEAHNLVPAVPDQLSESEESSAKAEASRYIANMLAEMRALGLSILIIDQTPAAVSQQVIRNTNLKIAHRTVAKADRETLADAMLMHPGHTELLGRLVPGQAYVYCDRFYRPRLVQNAQATADAIINKRSSSKASALKNREGWSLDDSELKAWLLTRRWFKESMKRRFREMRERELAMLAQAEDALVILNDYTDLIDSLSSSPPNDDIGKELVQTQREASDYCGQIVDRLSSQLRSAAVEQRAVATPAKLLKIKGTKSHASEALNACVAALRRCQDRLA